MKNLKEKNNKLQAMTNAMQQQISVSEQKIEVLMEKHSRLQADVAGMKGSGTM
jgi:FtsZ-binding cell division protein ZapB